MTLHGVAIGVVCLLLFLLIGGLQTLVQRSAREEAAIWTLAQSRLLERTGKIFAAEDAAWLLLEEERGDFRFSPNELFALIRLRANSHYSTPLDERILFDV
ncbi:MAG TPA: hypothetical protein VHL10_05210 [Nitrososphaera sp.]|jgi:hypothetical protein|nr:hypothetical protein [Nitrososphaera sp.]